MAPVGLVATLACFLLLSTSFALNPEVAFDCNKVKDNLSTCIMYLVGTATTPPATCCTAFKAVNDTVGTPENRRAACNCVRIAAGKSKPTFRGDRAVGINEKCDVNIPHEVVLFINFGCQFIR